MKRLRHLAALGAAGLLAFSFPGGGADAASRPPGVYTVYAKSFTSHWYGFVTLPVDMWVPLARGSINNLPFADADARLADPGLLVGSVGNDAAKAYTCNDQYAADYGAPEGFPIEKLDVPDEACRRTLFPSARSEYPTPDPTLSGQQDSGVAFDAVDGQEVGRIRAVTGCLDPTCQGGAGRVHSRSEVGAGEAGLTGYVRIGSAYAFTDLTADETGRLVGRTHSELSDIVIGPPDAQVRIDSLRTEVRVAGHESADGKEVDGFARVTGMTVMGTPVEVTRHGLRVADSTLPAGMAYEQAQALLDALAAQGVVIEVPAHDPVTVSRAGREVRAESRGISIHFLADPPPVDLPEGDLPVVEGPEQEVPVAGTVHPKVGGHVGGPTAPPPHEQRVDLGYSFASLTAAAGSTAGFLQPSTKLGPPGATRTSAASSTPEAEPEPEVEGATVTATPGSDGGVPLAGETAAGAVDGPPVVVSRFHPLSAQVADRLDFVMAALVLGGLALPGARFAVRRFSTSPK